MKTFEKQKHNHQDFLIINNEAVLLAQIEKFRTMAQRANEKGILSASKFEHKLLLKALDEGLEKLMATLKHITPDEDRKNIISLSQEGEKFLPFLSNSIVLSNNEQKQINRYYVKSKLRGESEKRISQIISAMTDSFIINKLIKATTNESEWQKIVNQMRKNFDQMQRTGKVL